MNYKQKQQRVEFFKKILTEDIEGQGILFSDETIIDIGLYKCFYPTFKRKQGKIKKWEESGSELVNRPQRKYELSIMIAGGICSKGLTILIFPEGTENECAYTKALFNYKDDLDIRKRKK